MSELSGSRRSTAFGAPTQADVARLAGVALGTVSNVLNKPDAVSDGTRRKVLDAIDQLGFVRNGTAGTLAKGTSNTIGFVIVDLGNTFFLDMVRGAEDEAQSAGKSLLLANSDVSEAKQNSYLSLFNEERVAGILLAPLPHALDHAERVRAHGRPVVVVNAAFDDLESCGVTVNDDHGGYLAAQHLIEEGRHRLAFVGGPDALTPIHDRHEGAIRAVSEAGPAVRLEYVPTSEIQPEDGRAIGRALAARPPSERPDGIIAAADLLAVGIVQSLLAAGISVPGDVAIIGYDNNRMAWDSSIPISTLSQPGREMGKMAAQLLMEEIFTPTTHVHRRVILEPTLIVRESTIGRQHDPI